MSQILSSQGKNAPSNPYPHYLVRLATSRNEHVRYCTFVLLLRKQGVLIEGGFKRYMSLFCFCGFLEALGFASFKHWDLECLNRAHA